MYWWALGIFVFRWLESRCLSWDLLTRKVFFVGFPLHSWLPIGTLASTEIQELVKLIANGFRCSFYVVALILISDLRLFRPSSSEPLLKPAHVPFVIVLIGLDAALSWFSLRGEISPFNLPESLIITRSIAGVLLYQLQCCLLGPAIEEILFRLILFRGLRLKNQGFVFSMITSTIVFTLYHLPEVTGAHLINVFVSGLAYCWAYERTGSLSAAFIVHAAGNAVPLIFLLPHSHFSGWFFT